jgi:hypothetical protein
MRSPLLNFSLAIRQMPRVGFSERHRLDQRPLIYCGGWPQAVLPLQA